MLILLRLQQHRHRIEWVATRDHGQCESRVAANYWLPLPRERAGVRGELIKEATNAENESEETDAFSSRKARV